MNSAKKCDKYVAGTVWSHSNNKSFEKAARYEGCKKGCFDNSTYDDNAVKKCQKCSEIEDERFCGEQRGCQWKKKGKCATGSCSKIAKNINTNGGRNWRLKECIEGNPEMKHFNDRFFSYEVLLGGFDGPLHLAAFIANVALPTRTPEYNRKLCENDYNSTKAEAVMINISANNPEYFENGYYQSARAYVDHWRITGLQACADAFKESLKPKENPNDSAHFDCNKFYYVPEATKIVETKAARKECHSVYGCMYNKRDNRCSVWAVWALVLFLVLMIMFAVAVVGGIGFFLLKGK